MKRSPMRWWKLAPALLLAGMTWSGAAAAGDNDRPGTFDGPGGLSGPADLDRSDRDGMRGDMHGDMHGMRHGGPGMRGGEGRHGRMGAGMRGHHQDVMAKLDLSDRQKEQIATIRQKQQRKMIPLHASLQEAALDLRELTQADHPDRARIDAAIDRMARLRAEAQKSRVATMLEVHSLLTDSQRKMLREQHGSRGDGMRDGGPRAPGKRGDGGKRGA